MRRPLSFLRGQSDGRRLFQAGTQRRSQARFQYAVHLAQSGEMGKLHTLQASVYTLNKSYDWLPAEPEPPKEFCDWDRWLGPVPWLPYNSRYVSGSRRVSERESLLFVTTLRGNPG